MKNSHKVKRIIEYLKTALIVLLFCSVVALASVYISRTQNLNFDREIPLNAMMVMKNDDLSKISTFDSSYVLPSFIGYKNGDTRKGIGNNTEIIKGLFESVSPYVKESLSSSHICVKLSKENSKSALEKVLNSDSYVYIEYPVALPSSVIYAFISGESSVFASDTAAGEIPYIKSMFVLPSDITDTEREYELLALNEDDECWIFNYENIYDSLDGLHFDIEKISAYDDIAGLKNFLFYGDLKRMKGDIFQNVKLVDSCLIVEDISCDNTFTVQNNQTAMLFLSDERISVLLSLLGFDNEKISKYSDSGEKVYVDSHGSLKINYTGKISYTANSIDTAASLSTLLNYENYSGDFSFFESLLASQSLCDSIHKLATDSTGGKSALKLSDIKYINGGLEISFGYYYSNVPVSLGEDDSFGLKLTIKDGRLLEFDVNPLIIRETGEKSAALPLVWSLERLDSQIEDETKIYPQIKYMNNGKGIYESRLLFQK